MSEIALSAEKIFDIAIKIEGRGSRFYRKAADKMDSPRKRQLLTELAIMEEGHIADFAEIRKTILELDAGLPAMPDSALLDPFLTSLTRLLIADLETTSEEALFKFKSVKDIVKTAMDMEKDSIIFYLAIRDGFRDGPERGKIDVILNQEQEHLILLKGYYNELESGTASMEI